MLVLTSLYLSLLSATKQAWDIATNNSYIDLFSLPFLFLSEVLLQIIKASSNISKDCSQKHSTSSPFSTNKQHNTMPAEILNQLESLVPEIEASAGNKSIGASTKTDPVDRLAAEMRAMKFIWAFPSSPSISFTKTRWSAACVVTSMTKNSECVCSGRARVVCRVVI